jgi:CxxC motif-containing protein (DUF1111 family)
MKRTYRLSVLSSALAGAFLYLFQVGAASGDFSAQDPGLRGGPAGAGGPLTGLNPNELRFFTSGQVDFEEQEEVDEGLGPRMNLDGCGGCHSQPATGGSSPTVNPQVAFATKGGGTDRVPSFIKLNGPIREARLVKNADGSPNGGVANTFTITGRAGATGCRLSQPDFATELANHNVIFRIPTPVFGAGLIEQIPDATILANRSANAGTKRALGITGQVNTNGNDGTITRFGWKAQNVSLLLFSGEAYNVEMGISNEIFQNEREQSVACQFATVPNGAQDFAAPDALTGTTAVQNFANFQRLLAAPVPSTDRPGGASSIANGRSLFASVGCALCHTPTMRTGNGSAVVALRNRDANLFSDLLVHNMGEGLADGVTQGSAGPREFRTAPLWGLGQRVFFLHDGRTSDLKEAIQEHRSQGSEANQVIGNFNDLRETQKQDILNFLRSL